MAQRREFLVQAGIVLGGVALASCREVKPETPTATWVTETPDVSTATLTPKPTPDSSATKHPTEIVKTPERLSRPETVLGVYLPFYMLKQAGKAEKLINSLGDNVNGLVIDIKSGYGEVNLDSQELKRALTVANNRGIYTVARMPVMVDTLTARNNPDLAMRLPDGRLRADSSGDTWLDPSNSTEIGEYNGQIALTAAELGFKEIQLDYIRLPEAMFYVPYEDRVGSIASIISIIKERLQGTGTLLTADLFANTALNDETDMGIGQDITVLGQFLDGICPMAYPNLLGKLSGGAEPYSYVNTITNGALVKLLSVNPNGFVNPWIQAYASEGNREGVQKQLNGALDGGASGTYAWNVLGDYPEGIYS